MGRLIRYHHRLRRAGLGLAGLLMALTMLAGCGGTTSTSTANNGGTPTATTSSGSSNQPTPTTPKPTPTPTKPPAPKPTPTSTTIILPPVKLLPSVHDVVVAQKLTSNHLTATCPTGEIALSGGWVDSATSPARVITSQRYNTNGWTVAVDNSSGAPLFFVHVVCLKNASGATITERSSGLFSIPASSAAHATASCGAGEVLVGGGFNGLTGSMRLTEFMDGGSSWGGTISNSGPADQAILEAECLSYKGASRSTIISPNDNNGAIATCPSGTSVSGGGFSASANSSYAYLMAPTTSNGWRVVLDPTANVYVYALCLKFS